MAKKKTSKKKWFTGHEKSMVLLLGLSVVLILLVNFAIARTMYVNDGLNKAANADIREQLLLAVASLNKSAPVDPKTGDVYFPEAKLYLPNPSDNVSLVYSANSEDEPNGVSVTLQNTPGSNGLYNAKDVEGVFDAVPKLQSCARGVSLVYEQFTSNDDRQRSLKHSVTLENGRELYVYTENECPELNETADLLKNVRSY